MDGAYNQAVLPQILNAGGFMKSRDICRLETRIHRQRYTEGWLDLRKEKGASEI